MSKYKVRTFKDSINEFKIKSEEDVQNERLRKIHTFKARLSDLNDYVNQRIIDTKKGN